jgi:hypothetical protein
MSTDINAYADTPTWRATAVPLRSGTAQVGRDRHFLTAVLAPGESGAQSPDAAAFDAAHRDTAPSHPVGGDVAGYASSSAPRAAPSRATSSPSPAHPDNTFSAGESPQAATPARGSPLPAAWVRHTAATPNTTTADVTASTPHPPSRTGEKPWLPQNITLHETQEGVDVITRNYFLDDAGRRQLAHRLLQDLRLAGKSPRQLTLNGELVWRADDSAPQDGAPDELAAGNR